MENILRILVVIIAIFAVLQGCRKTQLEQGDEAPAFIVKNTDGQEVRLSDYRGKIVLVHFWADCCADFSTAFPRLQIAYEKLCSQNFELLAINAAQPKNLAEYYADKYDITFPMLVDETADVVMLYDLRSVPANFMVSENGVLIDILMGWPTEEYLQNVITREHDKVTER